jgi:hypothetical protein
MHDEIPACPGRLQRWSAHVLDGENRWGFVRAQIDRFGVTRYRLVVYPPGITADERRRLRFWRGSPIWGSALWVLLEICLQRLTGSWTALAFSSAAVIVAAGFARSMVGEAPWRVRASGAVTIAGYPDAAALAAREKLLALATTLLDADERLDDGRISPLEHEALWWSVYDQLAPDRANVPYQSKN